MALTLGDNFSYQGAKPLDARLKYDTLADMKAVGDATMYDGCMAYCSATDVTYQWKSTNSVDASTGRWREFSSGGGGTDYTAGDGIDITNNVISTKQSEEGDIDEIIDVYPTAGELVSIVNAFNRGDIYSTDEKMIGQWISGKPLYQKVVQATIPSTKDAPSRTSLGVSVDFAIPVEAVYYNGSGAYIEAPVTNGTLSGSLRISIFNNSFSPSELSNILQIEQLTNTAVMAGNTAYVVVRYTKVGDTAISIGSENEYSTTEKVVGTWITGEPIWQKTVSCGALPNATSNSVDHHISNIDKIICFKGVAINNNGLAINIIHTNCSNLANQVAATVDKTKITIEAGSNRSSFAESYVTIQYTKTT